MNCPNCNANLPDGAASCSKCGAIFYTPVYPQSYSPVNPAPTNPTTNPNQTAGSVPPTVFVDSSMQKSKMAAGLLGIFLGGLGIHNFYLGYTSRGLIQLLVSLLTCGVGAIFMEIWGFVEGILYLTGHDGYTADARGILLKD